MSLKLSNNKNNDEKIINPDDLIKEGIDIIYQSFNSNMENYIEQINEQKKIIKELNKKIEIMQEEIDMFQRENDYYKSQNKKLKKEVDNLNKVVANIKGKLINYDFNLNNKQIEEYMSQNNLNDEIFKNYNTHKKNKYNTFNNIRSKFQKDINKPNYNKKTFYRDTAMRNKDISRNSHTLRYEIKNSDFNDNIYESGLNTINSEDIRSEIIASDNVISYINHNRNRTQLHTLYSELNIRNRNKLQNKPYNEENCKNNNYINNRNSFGNPYFNKKNINFNSYKNINTYRKKNKIRNNSLNKVAKREKINNEFKYLNKNISEKVEIKDKENIQLNIEPLIESPDYLNYNEQICKTIQSNKICNIKNNDKYIKELKMKEIGFFMDKCKTFLDDKIFENIIHIFQKYKDIMIKDKNIIKQIKFYLKSNEELLDLFNNIIL